LLQLNGIVVVLGSAEAAGAEAIIATAAPMAMANLRLIMACLSFEFVALQAG
jgi:hypothetical protein